MKKNILSILLLCIQVVTNSQNRIPLEIPEKSDIIKMNFKKIMKTGKINY